MAYFEYRQKYPQTVKALFLSSSGDAISDSWNGLRSELEKLGSATAEPELRTLRALTDIKPITSSSGVFLHKFEILAYDTTLEGGGSGQDASTVQAIHESRTNASVDAFAQTSYLNGAMPVNFQPNYCRPSLRIDGKNVIKGLFQTRGDSAGNKADLSIGLPLGHCFEIDLCLGSVNDIQASTRCAQYVPSTGLYQNYPVLMILEFWIGGTT